MITNPHAIHSLGFVVGAVTAVVGTGVSLFNAYAWCKLDRTLPRFWEIYATLSIGMVVVGFFWMTSNA